MQDLLNQNIRYTPYIPLLLGDKYNLTDTYRFTIFYIFSYPHWKVLQYLHIFSYPHWKVLQYLHIFFSPHWKVLQYLHIFSYPTEKFYNIYISSPTPTLQVGLISLGTPFSFTNKTGCHDITDILFKVAFTIINQTNQLYLLFFYYSQVSFWQYFPP